jgi:hypothetical protein
MTNDVEMADTDALAAMFVEDDTPRRVESGDTASTSRGPESVAPIESSIHRDDRADAAAARVRSAIQSIGEQGASVDGLSTALRAVVVDGPFKILTESVSAVYTLTANV